MVLHKLSSSVGVCGGRRVHVHSKCGLATPVPHKRASMHLAAHSSCRLVQRAVPETVAHKSITREHAEQEEAFKKPKTLNFLRIQ